MKIYLDVCILSRPFDNQNYLRINLETAALNLILSYIKKGKYEMIVSPVHFIEINEIPDQTEKIELLLLLKYIGKKSEADLSKAKTKTEELIDKNFHVADAAHVAFAIESDAVFISCDDKLIKQCKKNGIICENPAIFCEKEGLL